MRTFALRDRAILVSIISGIALLSLDNPAMAAGECLDTQYRLCNGECPAGTTDQGECTTRLEQVGGSETRWCCCENSFNPFGDSTTPADPTDSNQECSAIELPGTTTVENGCDPSKEDCPGPPWAASAAVNKTVDPTKTDNVLSAVRDNVLRKNDATRKYVRIVYRLADEIDAVYERNPTLVQDTARMLNENLPILVRLGRGEQVSVSGQTMRQVQSMLDRFAAAEGISEELKRAIASAQEDLRDRRLMRQLGVRVE